MKYKLSKFNIWLSSEFDQVDGSYVYNTFKRRLVKLPGFLNESELSMLEEDDIQALLSSGVIVEEVTDEIEVLNTYMDLKKYEQKRLMVTIIPTNACNFKCIYCYQPEKTAVMSNETAESIIKWFEKNLRYYDELNLGWFGGEPLLCSKMMLNILSKIHVLCKANGVAMVSSITSNGYLLDVDLFQQLLSNGLLYYQITIDGDEVTHNTQRPHKTNDNSYRQIMQNLSNISKLPHHRRFEIGIRINVSGNMQKENIYCFVDKMAEMISGDKRFVIIWQWVRDWGGERISQHDISNLVQTSNVCREYIDYAKSKGLSMPELISIMTGTDTCEAYYKNGYVINFDGRVYKCAMCMEDEKNNCIGYIDKNGIMRLDVSKCLKWLAHDKIRGECISCVYLPLCYTNRCHYSSKVKGALTCMEYKNLVKPQIKQMIEKHNYSMIGLHK